MPLNGTKWLYYVQLLDSALPIGGFSHSFGLETYVQRREITTSEQLESFIASQLESSLVPLDGAVIRSVYLAADKGEMERICLLDQIVHVQRGAKESREGLLKMGKRLLKLAKNVYPWMDFEPLEQAFARYGGFGSMPTIHAWISRQLDVGRDDAVKGYLYSSVSAQVNGAIRLMPVGQTEGQVIVQRLLPVIERECLKLAEADDPFPRSFALAQDIHAMNHETLYSRLFMS